MTPSNTSEEIVARPRRLPPSASGYTLRQQIGQGSSASVFRAFCKPLQDEVAIKVIELEYFQSSLEDIFREIQVMSLSSHENVVPFSTAFVNDADLWIVMPLLTGGSVLDLIQDVYPTGLPEQHAVYVLWSLLKAIDYFHRNNQIHRDVKAANILLDSKGNVMLSDYGMMGWMVEGGWERKQRQTFVGTPCWMAPEVMEQKSGYDYKADIWSLGITAIEIAEGNAPNAHSPPMKVLIMTLQNPPPTLKSENGVKYSDTYKDFVSACLKKNPDERPTSAELLQHPLFKDGVEKPDGLEDLIAQLPPIGSRGGAGQKQLFKQLTKVSTVSRSGIWERSARGQGWDFNDDDRQNGSSDNLGNTGPSDEGDHKPPLTTASDDQLNSGADNSAADRRYSFGTYEHEGNGRVDQFGGSLSGASAKAASDPMFALGNDGKVGRAGGISAANIPAKTVGMLRKGRFTVSDVAIPHKDKVESKLADFLDDTSSAGDISNSSSYNNMPPASNDGSPSGKNPSSSANSAHSQSTQGGGAPMASSEANGSSNIPHSSSAPVVMLTPSATQGSSAPAVVVTSAPIGTNGHPRTGRHSLPLDNEPSNASTQGSSTHMAPVVPVAKRKSRFEVYDVETSDAKPPQTTAAASVVSSSGASTPGQSGSLYATSKPRSKSRFEVADIPRTASHNATAASVPAVLSPRKDNPPAPIPQHPPASSAQSQSNPQNPQNVATVSARTTQHVHIAPNPLPDTRLNQMFAAAHDPTVGSVVANIPTMPVVPPAIPPQFPPVVDPVVRDDLLPAMPIPQRMPQALPQHIPSPMPQHMPSPMPQAMPQPMPQPMPQAMPQPVAQAMPQAFPPHYVPPQQQGAVGHHFPAGTAQQSNVAIQALSNVASLHTSILSMLQDADRVRQENEYLRRALAGSQSRQQMLQAQVQTLQQELESVQKPLREHQQLQQFQQFHQQHQHQQQLLLQQQLLQQQSLHVHQQPPPPTSTYVSLSQAPQVQSSNRHSLPNPSPPYSQAGAESSDAGRVQNVNSQRSYPTSAPVANPNAAQQGQGDMNGASRLQNATQLRSQHSTAPPSSQYQSQPVTVPAQQQIPPRPSSAVPIHTQQLSTAVRQSMAAAVAQAGTRQHVVQTIPVQTVQPAVRKQTTPITSSLTPNGPIPISSHQPVAQPTLRRTTGVTAAQQQSRPQSHAPVVGTSVQITSIPQSGSASRR